MNTLAGEALDVQEPGEGAEFSAFAGDLEVLRSWQHKSEGWNPALKAGFQGDLSRRILQDCSANRAGPFTFVLSGP